METCGGKIDIPTCGAACVPAVAALASWRRTGSKAVEDLPLATPVGEMCMYILERPVAIPKGTHRNFVRYLK